VARWKRPTRKQTAPPETLSGATVAAIRYVRNSPAILTLLLRTGVVLFFSSSLFALLPSVARSVDKRAIGYGLLLGCFGAGAIGGALIMQALRARLSTEMIVSAGVVILGIVIVTMPRLHSLLVLLQLSWRAGRHGSCSYLSLMRWCRTSRQTGCERECWRFSRLSIWAVSH